MEAAIKRFPEKCLFMKKVENEDSFENICKATLNRLKTYFLPEDLF